MLSLFCCDESLSKPYRLLFTALLREDSYIADGLSLLRMSDVVHSLLALGGQRNLLTVANLPVLEHVEVRVGWWANIVD